MGNKLFAVVLASGLMTPTLTLADSSFVTIYGRVSADFENVKASGGATPANDIPSRNRISSNSSYIGFRGKEELGAGVNAIFQIESGVAVDNGASSTGSGTFATRNSNVGLSSNSLGTVFYGNWETPYRITTKVLDPFYAISVFTAYRAIFGTPGGNVNSSPTGSATTGGASAAGFGRRENNSIQYWTPNYHGLSGRVAYEVNEGRSNTSAGNTVNPYLWSLAVTYDQGPYYLSVGYERHRDFLVPTAATPQAAFPLGLGTPTRSQDSGVRVGAGYTTEATGLGKTRLVAGYERLTYNTSGAASGAFVNSFDKNNYFVGVSHKIGGNILRTSYAQANDGSCTFTNGSACSTAGLGAKAFNVGYGYSLSKRTEVYVAYVRILNDAGAAYNFGQNAIGATVAGSATAGFTGGIGAGADPTGYGLGIIHLF